MYLGLTECEPAEESCGGALVVPVDEDAIGGLLRSCLHLDLRVLNTKLSFSMGSKSLVSQIVAEASEEYQASLLDISMPEFRLRQPIKIYVDKGTSLPLHLLTVDEDQASMMTGITAPRVLLRGWVNSDISATGMASLRQDFGFPPLPHARKRLREESQGSSSTSALDLTSTSLRAR